MIKQIMIIVAIALSLVACSDDVEDRKQLDNEEHISNTDTLNHFEINHSNQSIEVEPIMDSVQEEAYRNDLSLEIKPIKEEIEDPIDTECTLLLDEYAASIRSYDALLKKIEANPDNIGLMIERTPQEENLDSYATRPQFFSCLQNKAFKKQFDILNEKKDKLLYN
jgi:hypothetical protein